MLYTSSDVLLCFVTGSWSPQWCLSLSQAEYFSLAFKRQTYMLLHLFYDLLYLAFHIYYFSVAKHIMLHLLVWNLVYTFICCVVSHHSILAKMQWGYCKQQFKMMLEVSQRQTGNGECLPVWFVADHVTSLKGSRFKSPDLRAWQLASSNVHP